MENLCRELEGVYDRVKWKKRVRSWEEVSDLLKKERG